MTPLSVALLSLAFAVNAEKGAYNNPCIHGSEANQMYMEARSCPGPKPFQLIEQYKDFYDKNPTVSNLRIVFMNYCRIAVPMFNECFRRNIMKCPRSQQAEPLRVLDQSGFVCYPDSTQVHPNFLHLLSLLSDEDLANNAECWAHMDRMHAVPDCHTQAEAPFASLGLDYMQSAPVSEMASMMQRYFDTDFECQVAVIRENANRCPQWRGIALKMTFYNMLAPTLGRNMSFSQEQLAGMFEF